MLKQQLELHYRLLLLADVAVLGAAFVCAYLLAPWALRPLSGGAMRPFRNYAWLLFIILPSWILVLHLNGEYVSMAAGSMPRLGWEVLRTGLMSTGLLALYLYAAKNPISRVFISLDALLNMAFLLAEKTAVRRLIQRRRAKGVNLRNVLILGCDPHTAWAIEGIGRDPSHGARILACLGAKPEDVGKRVMGVEVRATIEVYKAHLLNNPIDEVLISPSVAASAQVAEILQFCQTIGVTTRFIPDYRIAPCAGVRAPLVEEFLGVPTLTFYTSSPRLAQLAIKRAIDVVEAALLLALLSPVFAVLAIAVKLTSPGPVFYRWRRLGRGARVFTGYKFRTMVVGADDLKPQLVAHNEMTGPVFKMRRDPRVTPLGQWLRKHSLDELPQLWSVLKGDMSLVGPRPPLPNEVELYDAWHRRKLSIKPGITCLWQVNGRNTVRDFDEWARLDLEYIDNWSLWLDFKIMLQTALVVVKGTGV